MLGLHEIGFNEYFGRILLPKPSLRVPRSSAEPALRILSELTLLDRNFKIKTVEQSVSIPLIRKPEAAEIDGLQAKLGVMVLEEDEFEPRWRPPRNLEEALAGKLSEETLAELPRSFDIVGDVAVIELGFILSLMEQKVAKAILEVHPNVKAVFAKAGPISGSERIMPLRHILGENRAETVHREFGCSFKVNLSKVFFSPRLSAEHQQVARQVVEGENVIDMFAGVGPFSVLIAKTVRNVKVDAIDSNPSATRLLQENVLANKVGSKVHVHPGDAREVVRHLGHRANRIVMNHPSAAKDFVDVACNALAAAGGVVHYYTFAGGEDPETRARGELETALRSAGYCIHKLIGVRRVREVAPSKWQIALDAEIRPSS